MALEAEELLAVATRMRELRAAKERRDGEKISQETAAHGIGVSSRTYRTWERKGADLKTDNLRAAALYYETTTDYIKYGTEKPAATPDLMAEFSSEDLDTRLRRIEQQQLALQEQQTHIAAALELLGGPDEPITPERFAFLLRTMEQVRDQFEEWAEQMGRDQIGKHDVARRTRQAARAMDRQQQQDEAAA